MASQIRIQIVERGDRGTVVVRWSADMPTGPASGQKTIGRLTGKKREDADLRKAAVTWADKKREELEKSQVSTKKAWSWAKFRKQYEGSHLAKTSKSNQGLWRISANHFAEWQESPGGRIIGDIRSIDGPTIEDFGHWLRKQVSAASTATYLATLRAGLSWAAHMQKMDPLPAKRRAMREPSKMRGRPITAEELERIVKAVPKVITDAEFVPAWQDWIRGLYLSGLRLRESMELTWDDPDNHRVMLTRIPKFTFAPTQKNREHQVVAMAPDFADFLRQLPRTGRHVFHPVTRAGRVHNLEHASRIISEIGEASNVCTEPGRTASAHDMRKAFGSRWSLLVMPPVLQHMMRHASITTTMKFYVNHTADLLGREISEAFQKKRRSSLRAVSADRAGDAIAKANSL